MSEKKYRWAGPHEWLRDAVHAGTVTVTSLLDLTKSVDADTIQDYFQPDMDKDGYFDELVPEPDDNDEEDEDA